MFDGPQWVEPGFVRFQLWRPDRATDLPTIGEYQVQPVDGSGGVARRP